MFFYFVCIAEKFDYTKTHKLDILRLIINRNDADMGWIHTLKTIALLDKFERIYFHFSGSYFDRSQEIKVRSFPRSGKYWFSLIIALIYSELTGKELAAIWNKESTQFKRQYRYKDSFSVLPHFLHTHGEEFYNLCRGEEFPVKAYEKQSVLLLVRDPRDVIVSAFYYEKFHRGKFDGTISDYLHFTCNDQEHITDKHVYAFGIDPIINYMNSFAENMQCFGDFYILHYEDLRANPSREIQRVFKHYDIEIRADVIANAVQVASLSNMREMEKERYLMFRKHTLRRDEELGAIIRKGIVGSHLKEIPIEDLTILNHKIDSCLHPFFHRYMHLQDFVP